MDFYYFGGCIGDDQVSKIEDHLFTGILFTYDNRQGDIFTQVARDIDLNKKIKYMVAIRPYTISPQYLAMINDSINQIMPNRLQINLITGHIKSHEKQTGGILGEINDIGSPLKRSEYLIDYMYCLNDMKKNNPDRAMPDYYISVTNPYSFETSYKLDNKMIIPYKLYNQGYWVEYSDYGTDQQRDYKGEDFNIKGKKVMISIAPVLRKTKEELNSLPGLLHTTDTVYFTYEEFEQWIDKVKNDGVNELMLISWPLPEREYVMDFVKQYKQKELTSK